MVDKKHTNTPISTSFPIAGVIISIDELDRMIEAYSMGPHAEWIDDYQSKQARRLKSQELMLCYR